ncbi:MAG: peptide deformylase [Syntrophomonadaceae bacterium]|nr:peptide deformylase [Syntrophomonadaceae bacterium]MDD3888333.1 peptide deformylase [Syntrophomonadaceae bacterium]MDD4548840.1 peptide deformylase [Syntrophomonadaceae bacterium]
MAIYQVVTLPDGILRDKAIPVKNINTGVLRLLDNMKDTMYEYDGIGLAAPQIGVLRRVVVIDIGDDLLELINPEIIKREGEQNGSEGCLSLPGIVGLVNRAEKVTVTALDRNGEEISLEGSGLLARALQHEIDHLDGILFIDKASETKKVK